ncbi:reverse transcriptase [Plakobranchus ocellatus]|uniref:Reverse transcriptase n=1 Tax=Plakobranchus ocellatus TaxID=259542 RepID=A0AAV4CBR3_9GAST|nr:reverse transcriptase [Plakobranchus ocellatus]
MSELDLYARYLDLGVKLGRSGEDLATWVEDKVRQDMERNDRQIERERKRDELQKQERESERQLELRRMELEAQNLVNVTPSTPTPHSSYTKPKLPPPTEFSQVDLYLERFENYAKSMKWQPAGYASCLANLLQGEALSVFLSLGPEDISDYQSVKKTLLRRFGCDRNGFKSKFFSARPSQDEDFATYINRIARYFNRWLELAQVTDFDSLSFFGSERNCTAAMRCRIRGLYKGPFSYVIV